MTELIYRKQMRPVVEGGAVAMDRLFPTTTSRRDEDRMCESHPEL